MRSVPGAHFRFDWCVNYPVRNLPLRTFYPGDQYVDIIGLDAYDAGVTAQRNRFLRLWSRPGGIRSLTEFATLHDKPMSLPEWGLVPRGAAEGGGDDPAYVIGIAHLIQTHDVAYSCYWFGSRRTAGFLRRSPHGLAALRQHFGVDGDAL